jgi:hypothetical protein
LNFNNTLGDTENSLGEIKGEKMSSKNPLSLIGEIILDIFSIFMDIVSWFFKFIERVLSTPRIVDQPRKITKGKNQTTKTDAKKIAPEPKTATTQLPSLKINTSKLGEYLDGWADLVEGMGEKAEDVQTKMLAYLKLKEMPDIQLGKNMAYDPNHINNREYILAKTNPGVTTTIYISKHGKDLYVSWRTWLKPVLNSGVFILIGIISAILGYASFGTHQVGGSLFIRGITQTWIEGWAGSTFVYFLLGLLLVSFLAKIFKGDPFAYFFIEPSIFDADDISAMSLSVHKSILRSLDQEGIDISKLRLKEKFTGGRKGEDI